MGIELSHNQSRVQPNVVEKGYGQRRLDRTSPGAASARASEPAPARPQDARFTAKNFQKSVFGLYLGSIRDQEIMIGLV